MVTSDKTAPRDPRDLNLSQHNRRNRIVSAALKLLTSSEYSRIQMRDVAETAGVAVGTVYHYFGSKEQLFAAVHLQWAGALSAHLGENPLVGTSDAERLRDIMHRSIGAFERQPQFFRLIMMMEQTEDPHALELFHELSRSAAEMYGAALHDADPSDRDVIVYAVMAVQVSGLRNWITGRNTLADLRAHIDGCIRLMLSENLATNTAPATRDHSALRQPT